MIVGMIKLMNFISKTSINNYAFLTVYYMVYRFLTANGSGFESFFTEQGKLIVVVGLKKEFLTFIVEDANIADQQWVCIIVHTSVIA